MVCDGTRRVPIVVGQRENRQSREKQTSYIGCRPCISRLGLGLRSLAAETQRPADVPLANCLRMNDTISACRYVFCNDVSTPKVCGTLSPFGARLRVENSLMVSLCQPPLHAGCPHLSLFCLYPHLHTNRQSTVGFGSSEKSLAFCYGASFGTGSPSFTF